MKNLFKNLFATKSAMQVAKQSKEVIVVEKPKKYSDDIEQIHHEFQIASELLLEEAEKHIGIVKQHPVEKVSRMKALGFNQAKQVEETSGIIQKAELSKEQVKMLMEYRRKYPLNKFITEEQVKTICYKYGLVCGAVSKFKGFLPDANLKEIERFKIRSEDLLEVEVISRSGNHIGYASYSDVSSDYMRSTMKQRGDSWYVEHAGKSINLKGGEAKWGESSKMRGATSSSLLKICAPVKDMDMTGMTIADGYKVHKVEIPDPVVLHPVREGYLILTAWGDEASDPIVVNEINN